MPLTYERTADPGTEPLTTAEAKAHCRVDISDDDTLIDALVVAAREWVERYTRRTLITSTWKLYLDSWGWPVIYVPNSPVIAISSIQYYDDQGNQQTWASANYNTDTVSEPGRIVIADGAEWPTLENHRPNAVTITYTAGYGANASDVPQAIRQAMLLIVGHWYENREQVIVGATPAEVPFAAKALLNMYRVEWGV